MAVVTQSMGSVMGRWAHSARQPRIRLERVPMLVEPVRLTYLEMFDVLIVCVGEKKRER